MKQSAERNAGEIGRAYPKGNLNGETGYSVLFRDLKPTTLYFKVTGTGSNQVSKPVEVDLTSGKLTEISIPQS